MGWEEKSDALVVVHWSNGAMKSVGGRLIFEFQWRFRARVLEVAR